MNRFKKWCFYSRLRGKYNKLGIFKIDKIMKNRKIMYFSYEFKEGFMGMDWDGLSKSTNIKYLIEEIFQLRYYRAKNDRKNLYEARRVKQTTKTVYTHP